MTAYMRLLVLSFLAFALLGASARPDATASPTTSLDLTAKAVDFYYNRFILTADGDVRIRLSDGTVITGQTFSMDLKLNRYLIAGDVHIDGPTIHQTGAAVAGYPDLDRTFVLTVGGSPPERYTYYGLNWSNPHAGHEQPGDAYYFPDLTGERAYIRADGARIVPKTNVLFDQARVYTAGVYVPLPRYVVTFAANSHFFENGFPGARWDVGLPFNGSAHSLTALHVRNDAFNGTYLAIDQHFVWDRDYIVAAIDPLTQEQRQYNLIGFKHFSPGLESRVFLQESAASPGIVNRPINAAAFGEIQVNGALRRSGLSYTQDNYYQYLLGYAAPPNDNVFTSSYDPRWREHPVTTSLVWTGYENHLTKYTPLLFRLRSGLGTGHDIYGYGGYPNSDPNIKDQFYHFFGGTVYIPALRLTNGYFLGAQYDRQRSWYNVPHSVDQAETRVSLSKRWDRLHFNTFISYDIKNTSDYWGSQQLAAYPAGTAGCSDGGNTCITPYGTFSGQNAFRGFSTSRGLTGGFLYTPTQAFALNLQLSHFSDFPRPVPGIYGQPPWQFSADMRVRISRQVLLDLSDAYYFNFANERWTQLGIQFSP